MFYVIPTVVSQYIHNFKQNLSTLTLLKHLDPIEYR